MKKFCLVFVFFCFILNASFSYGGNSFDIEWNNAQREYSIISKIYDSCCYDKYSHSIWTKFRKPVKELVKGKPNKKFLQHNIIASTMVWAGSAVSNRFEGNYIKGSLNESVRKKVLSYRDVDLSFLYHGYKDFDCSFNTLHHLYYATRCLDAIGLNNSKTIVEFGGGYGNLARIFKSLEPDSTIFVIDLPEFIFLQAVFLRSTLPGVDVIIHDENTKDFKKGAIHLIPVYLLEDMDVKADLFVSTFALSETTSYMQNLIVMKRFFNPSVCFITGQLSGWGKVGFEDHSIIHNSLKSLFKDIEIKPFHIDQGGEIKSYEAIAKNIL